MTPAELSGIFNAAGQGWSGWGAVSKALDKAVEAARAEGAVEAWDEGYCAGFDNGVDAGTQSPTTRHDNPYRAALATEVPA